MDVRECTQSKGIYRANSWYEVPRRAHIRTGSGARPEHGAHGLEVERGGQTLSLAGWLEPLEL